MRKSRYNNN